MLTQSSPAKVFRERALLTSPSPLSVAGDDANLTPYLDMMAPATIQPATLDSGIVPSTNVSRTSITVDTSGNVIAANAKTHAGIVFIMSKFAPGTVLDPYGAAKQTVGFMVPDKNANGWIIEHICYSYAFWNANGHRGTEKPLHYWHAWQVENGRAYLGEKNPNGTKHGIAALFTLPSRKPNTKGWFDMKGWAWFYPHDNKFNVNPSAWGRLPYCGDLPATNDMPAGWTDQGPALRELKTEWCDTTDPKYKTRIIMDLPR